MAERVGLNPESQRVSTEIPSQTTTASTTRTGSDVPLGQTPMSSEGRPKGEGFAQRISERGHEMMEGVKEKLGLGSLEQGPSASNIGGNPAQGIDDGSPRQTPAVRAAPELSKQSEEEIIRRILATIDVEKIAYKHSRLWRQCNAMDKIRYRNSHASGSGQLNFQEDLEPTKVTLGNLLF